MNEVVETLLDVKNVVGESIIFDDRRNALFWVDIIACEIHTLDLKTAAHRVWKTPEICTSIGLRADGGFVVGLTKNITLWDQGHTFDLLAQVEPNLPDNRLNVASSARMARIGWARCRTTCILTDRRAI